MSFTTKTVKRSTQYLALLTMVTFVGCKSHDKKDMSAEQPSQEQVQPYRAESNRAPASVDAYRLGSSGDQDEMASGTTASFDNNTGSGRFARSPSSTATTTQTAPAAETSANTAAMNSNTVATDTTTSTTSNTDSSTVAGTTATTADQTKTTTTTTDQDRGSRFPLKTLGLLALIAAIVIGVVRSRNRHVVRNDVRRV